MSRVHVKLYYSDFTPVQRAQIWQTFVDKLARERKDMRLHPDAKYYLKGKEVSAMKWNGREIRNGKKPPPLPPLNLDHKLTKHLIQHFKQQLHSRNTMRKKTTKARLSLLMTI